MDIKPFKFWCQTVLPTVYDDSLSYYELLCKVVRKLNETIDVANSTSEGLTNLTSYVNNYFANLDVQNEINSKLDEMAESGVLSEIINEEIFGELNEKINVISGSYIYVKMFGAKGDGVTDDTQAIKQAIESGSGAIIFSPGVYLISETINLPQTKYSSLILNNATIKQTVALNPMIKIASDDSANYPMGISGNGVIDMNTLGGVGIQITNNGGYSHIDDIQVRRCSNGIGILLGGSTDGDRVSLQCELNNVKIYGTDSKYEGVGLFINAYDCVVNNLYVYLCRKAVEIWGSGTNINFVHVWGHSYDSWLISEYEKTVGIDNHGQNTYGTVYLDTIYKGFVTNGYEVLINALTMTSDLTEEFSGNVVNKVIERGIYERIIINSLMVYEPRITTLKNQVIFAPQQSTTTTMTTNRLTLVNSGMSSVKGLIINDEFNNIMIQNIGHNITPIVSLMSNRYYLLGYVKSVSGVLDLTIDRKNNFAVNIKFRNDTGNTTILSKEIIYGDMNNKHIYIGEAFNEYGVAWLPLYLKYDIDVNYVFLTAECGGFGETGFYPARVSNINDLIYQDSITGEEIVF